MCYKTLIENEKLFYSQEEKRLLRHKEWIEVAEKYQNCSINWHIYWSRYRYDNERTAEEVIKMLIKED